MLSALKPLQISEILNGKNVKRSVLLSIVLAAWIWLAFTCKLCKTVESFYLL